MVIKKLSNKFQQTRQANEGKTTQESAYNNRRKFGEMNRKPRELMNRPIPEILLDIQPADTDLTIDCCKPSKTEIRTTIAALKNGKAVCRV